MAERCKNCGASLYEGQQFCRSCGTPTRLAAEDARTQILGGGQPADEPTRRAEAQFAPTTAPHADAPTQTVPFPGSHTDDVSAPRPTAGFASTRPLQAAVSPSGTQRRPRRFLAAFLIIGTAGLVMLASLLFALAWRRRHVPAATPERIVLVKHEGGSAPEMPAIPPMPQPPASVPGAAGTGATEVLDDAGAKVSDDKTVITRTYNLGEGALVALRNTVGKITVKGSDEDGLELKITKRGGTAEERRSVRILKSQAGDDALTLQAAGQPDGIEVQYELRLPRGLSRLEITAHSAEVKLSDFGGAVLVDVQQGEINLSGVRGEAVTKIIKGRTKIELEHDAEQTRAPCNFTSVNGDIEVKMPSDLNADVKAESVDGEIEVDGDLGLKVETRAPGQHVVGRIGAGGKPILVKVVNGTIKLKS